MKGKWLAWLGWGGMLFILLIALAAPWIAPHDPFVVTGNAFERPSRHHWLGTNDIGQDIFSELLYGTRTSLWVGFFSAFISMFLGTLIGVCAGWFGGRVDRCLMKVTAFFIVLPFIPTLIILAAFSRPGVWSLAVILGIMSWAGFARIIRSESMQIKTDNHVIAIKAMGAGDYYVLTHHVVRSLIPIIMYRFGGRVKAAILSESSLAFLGLGSVVDKSWGGMIHYAQSRNALLTGAWVWWIVPAVMCICFVSFSLALIGYGLEERVDRRNE